MSTTVDQRIPDLRSGMSRDPVIVRMYSARFAGNESSSPTFILRIASVVVKFSIYKMMIDDVSKNPPCLPTGRGSFYNTMKNTQIRCGTGRIRTANLSFITSALPSYYPSYRPDRQFLWPTTPLKDCGSYPHRLSGVSIAGPYEQISIVYVVWQIPLSFSFLLVTGFSGPVTIVPARFPVPGHTTRIGDAGFVAGLSPSTILLPTCQGTLLCSAGRTRTLHLARAWAALLLCYCGGPHRERP